MNVSTCLWYWTTVLQNVTVEGNEIKGTKDLSVLFLTNACESTMTSIEIFLFKKKQDIISDDGVQMMEFIAWYII